MQIRGEAYDENLKLHSKWLSTSTNIMPDRGLIIYTYSVESSQENTNNIGCANLTFMRISKNKAPTAFKSFSIDVQLGKKVPNYERKLTRKEKVRKFPCGIAKAEFSDNPQHL